MSYGSAAGVGALSALYSDNGTFTISTTPTLAQVSGWLDQVSSLIDSALADAGFVTPITIAAIVKELDLLANTLTNDLVDYSHKAGRFYPDQALHTNPNPIIAISRDLHKWIEMKAVGFELQGATKVGTGRNVATFDML